MNPRRWFHRSLLPLVAWPLLAAGPALARPWDFGGSATVRLDVAGGSLEVTVRPDRGRSLRLAADGPHRWVFDGSTADLVGAPYSILLRNRTGERLKVVVGVDGLNVYAREVVAGSSAQDVGSILSPWSDRTLTGWQLDLDRAQRFVFSPPEWSEGEGRTESQIGLLTVQVYREWQPRPDWGYRDDEHRIPRDAPAEPSAASPQPKTEGMSSEAGGRPPIGTTAGDDVASSVRSVRFVAATSFPEAWAVIDYGAARRAWQPPPRWPREDDLLGLEVTGDREGTRILAVAPGSAADRAGLEADDVILRLDSVFAPSPATTRRLLRDKDPGDYAFLRVRRGPHELAVKIRV